MVIKEYSTLLKVPDRRLITRCSVISGIPLRIELLTLWSGCNWHILSPTAWVEWNVSLCRITEFKSCNAYKENAWYLGWRICRLYNENESLKIQINISHSRSRIIRILMNLLTRPIFWILTWGSLLTSRVNCVGGMQEGSRMLEQKISRKWICFLK